MYNLLLIYHYFTGIGQSMMLLSCNVIIQQRFNKHRSLATGISILGVSIGNFIGAPLSKLLLDLFGLRGTLALLGAIYSHGIPLGLQFRSPKQFKRASNRTEVGSCWIFAGLFNFFVHCVFKNRTPVICSNNSNTSGAKLIIFGARNRHDVI